MLRNGVDVLVEHIQCRDGVSRITEAGDLNFEILNKCGKFDI